MLTLCAHCGTRQKHPFRVFPPHCPSCKKRLPFTLPRTPVYLARTWWKPALILACVLCLTLSAPQFASYRHALKTTFSQTRNLSIP